MEIGFDILKARDVPEEIDEDGAGSAVSAALRSSDDNAATMNTTAGTVSDENATAAPSRAVTKTDSARATTPTTVPKDGNMEAELVDDKRKRYRLMIKRRLLKRHGEELSTDATTRKRQLEELYRDVEAGLLSLGAKLRTEEQGKKKTVASEA